MEELPNNWANTKLINVCEILDSLRIPVNTKDRNQRIEGKAQDKLYPYYGATGQVGVIDDFLFEGEYVLLGEDGAPFLDSLRETAYIAKGKFWVNNHAHILKSYGSNKFLCHYLNQIDYSEYVTGTTRLKLNQARLKEITVKFPPLNEQKRIVAKIEKLFSELDKGIERLKTARDQLKVYRQAVLKHAFEGKLTEKWREVDQCDQWGKKILGDLILEKPKNGYSAKPVKYKTSFKVLMLTATTSGIFNPNYFKYFDEDIPYDSPFWLKPGDILVQRGNTIEYVGTPAIYDGSPNQYIYPDLMMKFRAKPGIITKFLYFILLWGKTRNYLKKNATGTAGTMPKINQKVLINTPINTPSFNEQTQIVKKIESHFFYCDQLEQSIEKNIKKAKVLRQSILKKAFSGQLVKQDPTDEPASVLIERIKVEKENLVKAAKVSNKRKIKK